MYIRYIAVFMVVSFGVSVFPSDQQQREREQFLQSPFSEKFSPQIPNAIEPLTQMHKRFYQDEVTDPSVYSEVKNQRFLSLIHHDMAFGSNCRDHEQAKQAFYNWMYRFMHGLEKKTESYVNQYSYELLDIFMQGLEFFGWSEKAHEIRTGVNAAALYMWENNKRLQELDTWDTQACDVNQIVGKDTFACTESEHMCVLQHRKRSVVQALYNACHHENDSQDVVQRINEFDGNITGVVKAARNNPDQWVKRFGEPFTNTILGVYAFMYGDAATIVPRGDIAEARERAQDSIFTYIWNMFSISSISRNE